MRKIKGFVSVLCVVIMIALTGCGMTADDQDSFVVYTSVYPVYDFTVKIAGSHAKVTNLVPDGAEPHDFELGTKDMAMLSEADVFVYCGAGMEHWVDKTLGSIQNDELVVVEASRGLELLYHEDQTDPHVWLAPENAILMMENIKNALVKADPDNKEDYEANYEVYKDELIKLHEEYESGLANVSKKDIVVAHTSFGYLCQAYGLKQTGIEGLMAHSEPDPATMQEIIQYMKDNNITTVFGEATENSKVVDTIAKETGATVSILNPIGGLSKERQDAGEDYISVMRDNLNALIEALK